jgi:hypothetical protein
MTGHYVTVRTTRAKVVIAQPEGGVHMTSIKQLSKEDVDKAFNELVLGIEELESLEAPGWGFWEGFAVGSVFAAAVVGGIALT